jgi:hypothetical protein
MKAQFEIVLSRVNRPIASNPLLILIDIVATIVMSIHQPGQRSSWDKVAFGMAVFHIFSSL